MIQYIPMKKISFFIFLFLFATILLPGAAKADTVVASDVTNGFWEATGTVVVNPASSEYSTSSANYTVLASRDLVSEPTIKVGIQKIKTPVEFVADFDYEVYAGEEVVAYLSAGTAVKMSYSKGKYFLQGKDIEYSGEKYLRFSPFSAEAYYTLPNLVRKVSGIKRNFNIYRGILEYRYAVGEKSPYIINELPLEQYVQGLAESANGAPEEYVKALMVAARSYAYVRIGPQPPADKKPFHVYGSTYDQLYLGYNSETLMPNMPLYAQATAGELVTYDSNPVTAPYFGRSNGQTKEWIWGNKAAFPWIQSVECTYDKGKKKSGHGVGMSQNDALSRASKDGWNYVQILKYYYKNIEVEKVY